MGKIETGMKFTKADIEKLPHNIRCQIEAQMGKDEQKKESKYKNKIVEYDGIKFRSQKECDRYKILKYHQQINHISNLRLQVRYELIVNDKLIEAYIADFVYTVVFTGVEVVEDCKGCRTATYKRKKKWMKSIYGIEIKET